MRLIDADANIETMKKCAENPENAQALLCYRYTQRILEEAPTVESISPWRRVEDELPPKGFALIGARKRPPEISEDVWDMWVCEYDGEWGWQDMDGYALRGITHWMPIEPPKEDE